jgi:hypothetical protein
VAAVDPDAVTLYDPVLAEDVEGLAARSAKPRDEFLDGWRTVAQQAQELPRQQDDGKRVLHASPPLRLTPPHAGETAEHKELQAWPAWCSTLFGLTGLCTRGATTES